VRATAGDATTLARLTARRRLPTRVRSAGTVKNLIVNELDTQLDSALIRCARQPFDDVSFRPRRTFQPMNDQPTTPIPARFRIRNTTRPQHALMLIVAACAPAFIALPSARGQQANPPAGAMRTATVRGDVFDSLTMSPVAKALVWIPATNQTTFADEKGAFVLNDVPVGEQLVVFSSPALDSLGLGSMGGKVTAGAVSSASLHLASPSFHTLWQALCKSGASVGPDSGIVWGTVRDAATSTRQAGARTAFNWMDMHVGADMKVVRGEVTRDVRTDSTGTYYACGLPTDADIASEAEGTRSASGVVQYDIGVRRVTRVDLLVSTDMVMAPTTTERTPSELAAALKAHGTSSLRGTVRDSKGNVITSASVEFASVDTFVPTNADGQFTLTGLPGGTHPVAARKVGFSPSATSVDLHPGETTEVDFTLNATNELATVNVRAAREAAHDRSAYDERRKAGFGYALEPKDFKDKPDMASVLHAIPSVTVSRYRGQTRVVMPLGSLMSSPCAPLIWIDGRPSVIEEADAIPIANLKAVEVFPHAGSAPPMYVGGQACGVILFWTVFARW
jgi:hypothetical protein